MKVDTIIQLSANQPHDPKSTSVQLMRLNSVRSQTGQWRGSMLGGASSNLKKKKSIAHSFIHSPSVPYSCSYVTTHEIHFFQIFLLNQWTLFINFYIYIFLFKKQ